MDMSYVGAAASAITAAKALFTTTLDVHNAVKVNSAIAAVNEQLLKAQDALFVHNTQLLKIQQEHFEATQKIRELEDALKEKSRYFLVEIVPGKFAYKSDVRVMPSEDGGVEVLTEPQHYICQVCNDKGVKIVLTYNTPSDGRSPRWYCRGCGDSIHNVK